MEWTEGDVVRKLRDTFGLTLDQLSEMSGASVTAINRLETGRTQEAKRRTLAKIAAVFSLSGIQLLAAVPKSFDAVLAKEVPRREAQRKLPPEHRRSATKSQQVRPKKSA